jgi:hypothetical protein
LRGNYFLSKEFSRIVMMALRIEILMESRWVYAPEVEV